MKLIVRAGVLVALTALIAAITAACFWGGDPSPEESKAAFCEDLTAFRAAESDLQNLNTSTATFQQYKDALEKYDDAGEELARSADDYLRDADAEVAAYNDAVDDLANAVEDLPDNLTVDQVRQQLAPQLGAVNTAREAIVQSADC